jgi:dienelactone hydrolase
MVAHLYLPKNALPPYQVVALYPTAAAFIGVRSAEEVKTLLADFIIRSGRALILPAYKGSLERGPTPDGIGPNQLRDIHLDWSKDLGRSLDYLETRPEIDTRKLAYYGHSTGGTQGPLLIAVEPRFNVAVLVSSGSTQRWPGEVDPWNFAPRVKIPVLMLNGRDDFVVPVETSQLPLFRLLGTPEKDKRHILYDGGHEDFTSRMDFIKEALDWLDRYLGPVKLRPS